MQEINYTFIIPHHNCPDLLDRCLNSIPQRDDIQIIVVDDNSAEDKKPIENGRAEVEYIYISKEESKGAGRARNKGLEKAKGKWLLFPDADDYYSDGFMDILDKYKEDNIDVLYFNFTYLDGETGYVLPDLKIQQYIASFTGKKKASDYIRYCNKTPWTKMVRSEFVMANQMHFEETPNGNDILFSMWVAHKCEKYKVINERLYNYVKTPGSIVTQKKSPEAYLFTLIHLLQVNYILQCIGHKEWKNSFILHLCAYIRRYPIVNSSKLLFLLLMNSKKILTKRKEWMSVFS